MQLGVQWVNGCEIGFAMNTDSEKEEKGKNLQDEQGIQSERYLPSIMFLCNRCNKQQETCCSSKLPPTSPPANAAHAAFSVILLPVARPRLLTRGTFTVGGPSFLHMIQCHRTHRSHTPICPGCSHRNSFVLPCLQESANVSHPLRHHNPSLPLLPSHHPYRPTNTCSTTHGQTKKKLVYSKA